jgi:hypothetical protein
LHVLVYEYNKAIHDTTIKACFETSHETMHQLTRNPDNYKPLAPRYNKSVCIDFFLTCNISLILYLINDDIFFSQILGKCFNTRVYSESYNCTS